MRWVLIICHYLCRTGCPERLQSSANFNFSSLVQRITDRHKTTSPSYTWLDWRSLCMVRIRQRRSNRTSNAGGARSCSEKPDSVPRSRTGGLASVACSEAVSTIRRCPLRVSTSRRRTDLPRWRWRRVQRQVSVVSREFTVRLHAATERHASCKLQTMTASEHPWMNVSHYQYCCSGLWGLISL